ncbi:MAG: Stk1 family PASTA domain-containing Ser/Thr kinase [Acidimicrobiales bacterium]
MTVNLPPGSEAPPPIYNGRYELRNQIARGGTAQVYLARDLLLDRPVALKVLFPELSSDSSFVERFRREAQAAANLSHPNIVPVFDWGESERTYFIVMEHIDGEPLSAIIRSQAPLPALRAASIAADIAKALSYAHRHGVVHRDVKPGNVLITRDGQVKVADFGIARAVGSDDNVTQTGLVMGTATYFSPEQAQGLGVDGRSDVYSLGVVIYEMVTGRAPFVADTPVAIAYKHVSESPVPPRELDARVPAPLEAIIMRAMAKSPADRYATAEDLHADLQRFMQGAPVLAPLVASGMATAAFSPGSTTTVLQAPVGGATTTVVAPVAGTSGATTVQRALDDGRGSASPPDTPVMPKKRWLPWSAAAVALAVLLAFLVVFGAHQLGYLGGKSYVDLPAVDGRLLSSALKTLKNDGLTPVAVPKENGVAKNTVLYTVPAKGHQVQQGQSVEVVYSTGPGTIPVPGVIDDNLKQAESAILSQHLRYKITPVTPQPGQPTGIVTSTSPAPNTAVLPGDVVTLTVTEGVPLVKVPSVTNDSVTVAQEKISRALLSLGTPIQQLSGTVGKGLVIGTSPSAGNQVQENSSVSLIVSEGPGINVPRVVLQNYVTAEKKIHAAGLLPLVQFKPSSPLRKGLVLAESPTGQQPVGTTITLTVGQGQLSTVTVTSPGAQGATVGTAITPLQILATDSGTATLTYAATGLPPGLSIGPSSGLVTGTPTVAGSDTVTVTVTDSTGATGSVSFTWSVTPSTTTSTTSTTTTTSTTSTTTTTTAVPPVPPGNVRAGARSNSAA